MIVDYQRALGKIALEKQLLTEKTMRNFPHDPDHPGSLPWITAGDPSNPDTNGTEEHVHISEVSLFQLLARTVLGERKGVLMSLEKSSTIKLSL